MAKPPKKVTKNGSTVATAAPANGNVSPFGGERAAYPTTIEEIVAIGPGGTYARPEVFETLVKLGLAEVNTAMHDGNGGCAIRATPKGLEYVAKQRQDAALSAVSVDDSDVESDMDSDDEMSASGFELEDGIDVPQLGPRIGFGRKSLYPFATMNVGQSFLVKGVEKDSKKYKGLASTVSAAQRRFATPIEGQTETNRKGEVVQAYKPTRRFVLRPVDGGARVWRTA